ncbi:MAG: PCRF domain-containing protein, partial [Hyphomicrobiaceae bacterium]
MSGIPEERLDRLVDRWHVIQAELTKAPPQPVYVALSKEFAELDPLIATVNELRKVRAEKRDLEAMARDPAAAGEMAELAEAELGELVPRLAALEHKLKIQLLPKDSADERSAILEVRAGTGGDEAALFAADLFR